MYIGSACQTTDDIIIPGILSLDFVSTVPRLLQPYSLQVDQSFVRSDSTSIYSSVVGLDVLFFVRSIGLCIVLFIVSLFYWWFKQ